MLYNTCTCTNMAAVGVKGLTVHLDASEIDVQLGWYSSRSSIYLAYFPADIADKRFRLLRSMLYVPWSVCLSRSCIVLKRLKISTRFLLRATVHVSPRSTGQPLPPQILPQSDSAIVDLGVGDIRWHCVGMVRDSKIATPPSLFRMVASNIADPLYDLPFSQNGVPNAPSIWL